MQIRPIALSTILLSILWGKPCSLVASDIIFTRGKNISYSIQGDTSQVITTALRLFAQDAYAVLGAELEEKRHADIIIRTLSPHKKNRRTYKPQGFCVKEKNGKLYVTGEDLQGTAYAIMELSRMLGVSPWAWWADNVPTQLDEWTIQDGFSTTQSPAIEYRGIFINDEGSAFTPWSWKTFDPSTRRGRIGPKTHEKIFELMLRLRANLFWPAMHTCSTPFFTIPGNQEMADRYGITIGTSHCEPMLRNTNGEWSDKERGPYNYVTNRKAVIDFWTERIKKTAHSKGFYTLGMRGKHDTGMEGVKGIEQQRQYLQQVIDDQRQMLSKYVNSNVEKIPQVFIPYKEVLEVYKAGLKIPEDVTLMWCDDNYGYIRHQPDHAERRRKGGNGVYYHFSYWGRPQSHVWLPSISPSLAQTELSRAYQNGIRRMWVFNVGDIKPLEFLTEYGLEMAWDKAVMNDVDSRHYMLRWLQREFGEALGQKLLPAFETYYNLSYRCRAEGLGHTRVEESDKKWLKVNDLPWTDNEVTNYLDQCLAMENDVRQLSTLVDKQHEAQFFELVEYPCRALTAMARKMLYAQLARHGKSTWDKAIEGHKDVFRLRDEYHKLLGGKWNNMAGFWTGHSMYRPLDTTKHSQPRIEEEVFRISAENGKYSKKSYIIPELGYSRQALNMKTGGKFTTPLPACRDSLSLRFAFIPNHPVRSNQLAVDIRVGKQKVQRLYYQTEGRSEEWKQNVERNQARRTILLPPSDHSRKLTVTAKTEGVILDEIIAYELQR